MALRRQTELQFVSVTTRPGSSQSLLNGNSTTFTAIAVAIAYIILAQATGIVLIGFVPVMLSIRAFERRERLAPVGITAAAIAVVFSLSTLSHH